VEDHLAGIKTRNLALIGVAVAVLGLGSWAAYGQFSGSRYTSPAANATVTVAGKQISVDYYAPSAHGRKIMGGLVPFGAVWCTGANWATKLTTAANLQLGNLKLPAGSYSIWTLPTEKEWTLIINKETGQYHLNYDSSRDFGRTKMNLKMLSTPVETFKIDLRSDKGNQGTLTLIWETTEASIPFTILQ
jgi:hypothetical protein